MRGIYRPDIDGLRAFAVLGVVVFHAFPSLLPCGFVGVDVFFVISGYLITGIILKGISSGDFSFRDFYGKRIRRIFPALILMLIGVHIWGWFYLLPNDYMSLAKHTSGVSYFFNNIMLYKESGYFDAASHTKPLLHLWSLAIEEQFYIFFPVLLFFTRSKHQCWIILFFITISIILCIFITQYSPIKSFYMPYTRFWELWVGAFLAWSERERPQMGGKHPRRLIWMGVASGVGCLFLIRDATNFPGMRAILPVLCAVGLIGSGPRVWLNRWVLSHPICTWFGRISYPLYLYHWPMLVFLRMECDGSPSITDRLAVLLVSTILSFITYKFLETPIRFDAKLKRRSIPFLVSIMALNLLLSHQISQEKGFPKRWKEIPFMFYDYIKAHRENLRRDPVTGRDPPYVVIEQPHHTSYTPTILIWGDSHAGHLLAGFEYHFAKDWRIILCCESGRLPIFTKEWASSNQRVIDLIESSHPHTLILAGRWSEYNHIKKDIIFEKIKEILTKIKKNNNIEKIFLMGSMPEWKDRLTHILFSHFKRTGQNPNRLTCFKKNNINKELEKIFGDILINPEKYMLNEQGLVAIIDHTENGLAYFDTDHLTKKGSIFFVEKIKHILE